MQGRPAEIWIGDTDAGCHGHKKKHVQYNPHTQKMSGFVDMGDGLNETDVASEALVFMVVGIQGHWKAQIAYYLTNAVSPETLKVLVAHALEELHARGLRVVCMTMDGHALNVSMCFQLGCELKGNPHKPRKTFFPHPETGERVFVMMDACHMLKLARNMLQVNADCFSTLFDSSRICLIIEDFSSDSKGIQPNNEHQWPH